MPDDLRARIVSAARARSNQPWSHHGRGVGGLDCAGMPIEIGRELGFAPVELRDYPRQPNGNLVPLCDRYLKRKAVRDLAPGDMVVMQWEGEPQHIGLIADYRHGGLSLVHASNRVGKVVEHRLSPEWRDRIVVAYDPPEAP